ncbi:MAG: quinone-dependent dihydroorotate dehydrogenase [Methylotenera sp.]|nr:quinone-dependent dihydroorotate dehydrogenase [Oligoflexia bacterium]
MSSGPFWGLIKSFLFLKDAESVHHFSVRILQFMSRQRTTRAALRAITGGGERSPHLERTVSGLHFRSPLGLAAGFDKDAELLAVLPDLGFGFAEIGTVTPRPQAGNERPRLFRDPPRGALFNRMGFNGKGSERVARNLETARSNLPTDFRVGVNIGKNKDTPLHEAHLDYVSAARAFEGLADYLVINVSSPNTPGLRSLQSLEALQPIIEGVRDEISGWKTTVPLFLKLAPEVNGTQLAEILSTAENWGVNGWVLTNTLAGNWSESVSSPLPGGWSGALLTEVSRNSLLQARPLTRLPIISVGGISTSDEAVLRLKEGADLVQIYSGWVFNGPRFPAAINKQISQDISQIRL